MAMGPKTARHDSSPDWQRLCVESCQEFKVLAQPAACGSPGTDWAGDGSIVCGSALWTSTSFVAASSWMFGWTKELDGPCLRQWLLRLRHGICELLRGRLTCSTCSC